VERLTLLAGIRLDELDQLLDTLADRATETVSPSDHVVVEASSASAAQLGEGMTTPAVSGVAIRDRVQVLRETFAGVRDGEPLPVAVLSELVRSVDQQLRAATSPLALLAPLERDGTAAELWPAVHAHNVAVLTLACAQLLELADLERAEVGLAAVLHDLGKVLGDPNELIRELAHTGPELELDRDHPRRGYAYLIRVPTLPPLVPVVAIEHHVGRLRGGYPALPMAHTAHPVSGMVAVAEAFDVLHTVRAPAGLVSREALSAQLEEMALTRLDPLFVQVITQLMPIDEAEG
jgi:HD-GYP domain-containing protein (c-di-GMP phosphodiesterase class II)